MVGESPAPSSAMHIQFGRMYVHSVVLQVYNWPDRTQRAHPNRDSVDRSLRYKRHHWDLNPSGPAGADVRSMQVQIAFGYGDLHRH